MNNIFTSFVGSAVFAFGWAKLTHIGPVILTISEEYGLGVHSGDLIGLIPMAIVFLYSASKLNRRFI